MKTIALSPEKGGEGCPSCSVKEEGEGKGYFFKCFKRGKSQGNQKRRAIPPRRKEKKKPGVSFARSPLKKRKKKRERRERSGPQVKKKKVKASPRCEGKEVCRE